MSFSYDVLTILWKAASKFSTKRLTYKIHDHSNKKQEYVDNWIFVTIQTIDDPSENLKVVVKKSTSNVNIRKYLPVCDLYGNEIHFYDNIWPKLTVYQQKKAGGILFNKIPICFATDSSVKREKLVLENLGAKQFEHLNVSDCFSKEHLEWIVKQYGKFHALSFAYKIDNKQLFFEICQKFNDTLSYIPEIGILGKSILTIITKLIDYLREEQENDIVAKFEKYAQDLSKIYAESTNYRGTNEIIIHGNGWSKNVMFRYNADSRKIEDMRFLNFQYSRLGTPVYDLSLCLYSGGTEEIYNDLEHYLQIYYKSLSETLKIFNYDPEQIYPFEILMLEWKKYCQFGFLMGLLLLRPKLSRTERTEPLSKLLDKSDDSWFLINESEIRKRALPLIRHMYKNDYL